MAQTEMKARNIAAHEALRVVERYGIDSGVDVLKGYAAAFFVALIAVIGRDEAMEFLSGATKPDYGKPYLVFDNNNNQPAA